MGDKEDLEKIVNKPGTFSKLVDMPLKTHLKESLLREKRKYQKKEYTLKMHLTQKNNELELFGEGFFSIKIRTSWTGIIFNKKLTELVRGKYKKILKKDIEKLINEKDIIPPIPSRWINMDVIKWKNWKNVEVFLKEEEMKIVKVREENENILERFLRRYIWKFADKVQRERIFGEYIFTLAALENLVEAHWDKGVSTYFLGKDNVIRPINNIHWKYINAIVKKDYTAEDLECVKKFKNKIKFYTYNPETGYTKLLN